MASKTGGGRGTNQHKVQGTSIGSRSDVLAGRARAFSLTDDDPVGGRARRVPMPGSYLSGKASLAGGTWEPMDAGRAEVLGMAVDGFTVVETSSRHGRAYVRDSGRTLPANRTRGPVAVFDMYPVETYAAEVDGRPTILGRPAAERSGELFLLTERTT